MTYYKVVTTWDGVLKSAVVYDYEYANIYIPGEPVDQCFVFNTLKAAKSFMEIELNSKLRRCFLHYWIIIPCYEIWTIEGEEVKDIHEVLVPVEVLKFGKFRYEEFEVKVKTATFFEKMFAPGGTFLMKNGILKERVF